VETGCCGNRRDYGGSDGFAQQQQSPIENLDKTISELAQEGYEIKAADDLSANMPKFVLQKEALSDAATVRSPPLSGCGRPPRVLAPSPAERRSLQAYRAARRVSGAASSGGARTCSTTIRARR
jgi:hypothetical protein